MIDIVDVFLPMLLYIFGIILLIILIILGIKLIGVVDKADKLIDNVEDKVNTLNAAFSIIDRTTDSIISVGNTVVKTISSLSSRILNRKKYKEDEEYE